MEFKDIITETLAAQKPLLIPLAFVMAMTIIAVAVAVPVFSKIRAKGAIFGRVSVLYELDLHGAMRLACGWVKLCLLVIYLILFEELSVQEYLIFLIPGLLYALDFRNPKGIPGRVFWLVMELIGLMTAQIVCSYITDMRPGKIFTIIYIAIAVFLVQLGVYIFIAELGDVSESRRPHLKRETAEEKNGNDGK